MIFKLEIALGNAAMQEPSDVADALGNVAGQLQGRAVDDWGGYQGIKDENGNQVGSWHVEEE